MQIDDLKELKKLIQLCRLMGVEAIEVAGIKMNLGPTPVIQKVTKAKTSSKTVEETTSYPPNGITAEMQIPNDSLTEEQLLYYSSQSNADQQ